MRELVMRYLSDRLSRRGFLKSMTAAGFSAVAAQALLDSLAPLTASASSGDGSSNRRVKGPGGEVLVEQWEAADVKFIFNSNSSHLRNIMDALIDRPHIHPILAVEEGVAVAVAAGYSMASGRLGVVAVSAVGAPNCATNMYNAMTARLPLMVMTDMLPLEYQDREGITEGRKLLESTDSTAKWRWMVKNKVLLTDITRRAIKVATTAPGGPVLATYPEDVLNDQVEAEIIPQSKFNVPAIIKAPADSIERAARLLLEAKSPCMWIGSEAWTAGARPEFIELAETLGIPAMRVVINSWADCFPTAHPLFVNAEYYPNTRFPRNADLLLVAGSYGPAPGSARKIHITTERDEIGKGHPAELSVLADTRSAVRDIIDAAKSMATKERLESIARPRAQAIREFNESMARSLQVAAQSKWDRKPISWQRVAVELDRALDPDALIVEELSTEKTKVFSYIRTQDGGRTRIGRNIYQALGWGVGLSIGAKIAIPDRQVACLVGDGAFMFGQFETLWTMSRYDVPVLMVVFNNRSYNEPRNRAMGKMGKQGQTGKDMNSYLGDPDVDFARIGAAFSIPGEVVENPGDLAPAIQRGIRATREGRPYILDVVVGRTGIGAESTWYPEYSVARRRSRPV